MSPPPNAYQPGKRLQVGSHQISIIKYISEGGFAHVYTCKIEPAFHNNTTACLKRVVVPNKWQLTLLRQEVDAMKRLRGNGHIVSYIDLHAARLGNSEPQQYEVLLLMEYCLGNGLIDFMNTRLTHRLTEVEILQIMSHITVGVAMCHHLSPPLLHRDIKIENVLIDHKGTYKLCDFGLAVNYAPVPKSAQELQTLHEDIMRHTTPQYRAPEMIELGRFPVDDKLDVWALGCFLYKLCYYTTPFELPNQKTLKDLEQLIVQCLTTLRFPGSPQYSPRLQNMIRCCLRADPRKRPNALQLLQEVSLMQGRKDVPSVIPYLVRQTRATESKARTVEAKPDIERKVEKKPEFPRQHALLQEKYNGSLASLQDLIKQHVNESTIELNQIRKSEDLDRGTMDFLRSKDEPTSRQNTGGSFSALKSGLRKISTGGSIGPQRSGSLHVKKRASTSTVKQIFTGGRKASDAEPESLRVPLEPKKTSIQKRMSLLLGNKDKKPTKTALGYGRYTDQEDISAINYTDLLSSASAESLGSGKLTPIEKYEFEEKSKPRPQSRGPRVENVVRPIVSDKKKWVRAPEEKPKHTPPPCPPSLSNRKKPPPKPTKPGHLKVPDRRASTSSDTSMPDLDDLERQFSKRFPSYV